MLSPFTTDGCSLFPDGTFSDKTKWQHCCIEHDISYWKGGSEEDRKQADLALKNCVMKNTGDVHLARTMYDAVRIWGSPIFPSWYRWGYGWAYGRDYTPLSKTEQGQIDAELANYYKRSESN